MFNVKINGDICKGCGLCASVCPKKIIGLSKTGMNEKGFRPAEISDMKSCVGCISCALICPDMAITVTKEEK